LAQALLTPSNQKTSLCSKPQSAGLEVNLFDTVFIQLSLCGDPHHRLCDMYAPPAYGTYDVESIGKASSQRLVKRKSNLVALMGSLLLPLLIFATVFAVRSFKIRYEDPGISTLLCLVLLVFVFVFAAMALNALSKGEMSGGDPRLMCFVFFSTLLAWIVAYIAGDINFHNNMQPFYEISELNTYTNVDPALYGGNQLMDAGQINFSPNAHLDLTKSAGFMNKDFYCVTPIISGNSSTKLQTYDFWAIGINCCNGHPQSFTCGEYNDQGANHGLRLLRDDQREYFRLAVKMAESSFSLKANHPIFMYWMKTPSVEINAYQDDGFGRFMMAASLFGSWQLLLVVVMGILLSKT